MMILCIYVLMSAVQLFSRVAQIARPADALLIAKPYLPKSPVIVDAGAYDGKEITQFFTIWPNCVVHAFEPVPENFKLLKQETFGKNNIYRYQLALGDATKEVEMYVSSLISQPNVPTQSSSLLPPRTHLLRSPEVIFPLKIQVPCMTLDTWARIHDVDHVDLLWLDMQGYELQTLKASPAILKTVRAIVMEVEFEEVYSGQAVYSEIKQWLEEQGFSLIAVNFNQDNPEWMGDALFVRTVY